MYLMDEKGLFPWSLNMILAKIEYETKFISMI